MSRILWSGRKIGQPASEDNDMLTKCYFCQGKVEPKKVDVDFRWGRKLKVIKSVPAGVCQQCGEKYFEAGVYKAMERLAASRVKPAARLTVDVVRFQEAV